MRTGKIARLPAHIREELNLNLHDGIPAVKLVQYLNRLPEVQAVLAELFGGRPISKANMSEWVKGGYRQWLTQHQFLQAAMTYHATKLERQQQLSGLLALDNPAPTTPEPVASGPAPSSQKMKSNPDLL
jgi:hypothetical protein